MTTPPRDPAETPADERSLLLNAYVDGEATPQERARVEADPELVVEAERLGSIKAQVAAVPPPHPDVRSRLLAAALAEAQSTRPSTAGGEPAFPPPGRSAAGAPVPPPTPLDNRRRGRITWLAAAAAIVAVLAIGGTAFNAMLSEDDDDGDIAADEAAQDERVLRDDSGSDASAADSGEADTRSEDADESEDDHAAPPAAEDPGDGADATADTDQPPGETTRRIADRDELAEWYLDVRYGTYDPPGKGTVRCDMRILGEAVVADAVVVVVTDSSLVVALDAYSCDTRMSTPVPPPP